MIFIKTFAALAVFALLSACGGSSNDEPPEVNSRPVANDLSFTTQADTALEGMLQGEDPEGKPLSYSLAEGPELGTLEIAADGSFVYTPPDTMVGSDSFSYKVTDDYSTSIPAVVSITIDAQQVSFSSYSRDAFAQMPEDEPLPTNAREFEQDVIEPTAYDDLLQ